jgi:hypothetical protein
MPRAYGGFRSAVGRGQRILEDRRLSVDRPAGSLVERSCRRTRKRSMSRFRATRLSHALICSIGCITRIGLDQFEKDVLQDILRVRDVSHPPFNEAPQTTELARDDLREVPVLFEDVEVAD